MMPESVESWREDEARIDGGYSGNEYPRLWPPRFPTLSVDLSHPTDAQVAMHAALGEL